MEKAAEDDFVFETIQKDAVQVILSVEGDHGTRIVIDDLLAALKSTNPDQRLAAITLMRTFCKVGCLANDVE